MRYGNLGKTGLEVSVITLGCMSFGESDGRGRPWMLDEAACREIVRQALDARINFFAPRSKAQ
jgi:aryl-alcohol dehydrogenase-like predicted oxidoreductase